MNALKGQHILSVSQFDLDTLALIIKTAEQMSPYARRQKRTRVLDGAILGNMFFEPSTRTRLSFGAAFNLLGGEVRETTGIASSSLVKGESLYDTAQVMSGYSDIIAMRHPEARSVGEFAAASRVPVVNGGDGPNEHPTQALLDLYTIQKELQHKNKAIDGMTIAMLGDLKHGRTVHSLSQLLALHQQLHFIFIAPEPLQMPDKIVGLLEDSGHQVTLTDKLAEGLPTSDLIYQTRIQEERFASQQEADQYRGVFRLNQSLYSQVCDSQTIIMHPLPRDSREQANELDNDLNSNPNLAIFRQTDNGVMVRMALFALIMDVAHLVDKHSENINWYVSDLTHSRGS